MRTPEEHIDFCIAMFQERLNSWLLAPEDKKSYEHIVTLKGIVQGLEIAKEGFLYES